MDSSARGRPEDYAPGVIRVFEEGKVIVFSDLRGLHAISLECTHLGCTVTHTEAGFQCPCHGSKYAADGRVIRGPAPRALPWLRLALLPDGRLAVHRDQPVRRGQRFRAPPAPPREDAPA